MTGVVGAPVECPPPAAAPPGPAEPPLGFFGDLVDGDAERAFREWTSASERRLGARIGAVAGLLLLLFLPTDRLALGPGLRFDVVLAARVGAALAIGLAVREDARSASVERHDRAWTIAITATVAATFVIGWARPTGSLASTIAAFFGGIGLYLVPLGRLGQRTALTVAFTAAVAGSMLLGALSLPEAEALVGTLVAANLVGFLVARHAGRLHRRLFVAWQAELDARHAAERARAEVKVLRGILPICSFCKRVRHGDAWLDVERVIAERSEARFSHGFCPECVDKHYGDLPP